MSLLDNGNGKAGEYARQVAEVKRALEECLVTRVKRARQKLLARKVPEAVVNDALVNVAIEFYRVSIKKYLDERFGGLYPEDVASIEDSVTQILQTLQLELCQAIAGKKMWRPGR